MLRKILLVEDEPLIRDTLTDLLSVSYVIKSACDGKRALEVLPLYKPHLVISDIMMPGMDGITFLKHLKSNSDWNDIPTILLTAKGKFSDRIEGLDNGADAYIAKPFNFKELSLIVRNLLKLRTNIQLGSSLHTEDLNEAGESLSFTKKLAEFIMENMESQEVSLAILASHFSMSTSGFKRKLKRTTGKSSQEFVREFRLQKSHEYLITQDYNVSEVARMTGFRSISHFSDAFTKYFGMNPSNLLV